VGKLPPFGPDEGMSFGRQTHDFRKPDMSRETQDAAGRPYHTEGAIEPASGPKVSADPS
jgi:NADH-quinone oxidoreductase subunit C